MQIKFRPLDLELEFVFRISRSSTSLCQTILLQIEAQGHKAWGEAVFSSFYGETAKTVIDFYEQINSKKLLDNLDLFDLQDFEDRMAGIPGNYSAKAGLDIALYDLRSKIISLPLYRFLGLNSSKTPKTSYTIGLADIDEVKRKTLIALERGYDILKVKLGGHKDIKTLELIRELAPKVLIRVDANAAWTLEDALKTFEIIKDFDIEFVEEPLRLDSSPQDYEELFAQSPLLLMADESCHRLEDIVKCAKYFHSINIKHTKSGGLSEAIKMIHAARALNLKIMLGCFCESSLSISALASISPLVDYADLDGSLLVANDPFGHCLFDKSHIKLQELPGLGLNAEKFFY